MNENLKKQSFTRITIAVLVAAAFSVVMAIAFAMTKHTVFALVFVFFAITDTCIAFWFRSQSRRIEKSKPDEF